MKFEIRESTKIRYAGEKHEESQRKGKQRRKERGVKGKTASGLRKEGEEQIHSGL